MAMKMKRLMNTVVIIVAAVFVAGIVGTTCLFLLGRSATEQEWQAKAFSRGARGAAVIKGILDFTVEYHYDPPNMLPVSGRENSLCALAVVNYLNFAFGAPRFKPATAWTFFRENEDQLVTVYQREKDFAMVGENIEETFDRQIWLHGIIPDENGLYVLGYLYRETQMEGAIVRARSNDPKVTLNSHLMVLLPKKNGARWGYHLFHRPGYEQENPVKVERLADTMPDEFDLIYVWRIKGISLPEKGDDVYLVNNTLPYKLTLPWLSNGPRFLEYYLDTAAAWVMNKYYGREQFPAVVKMQDGLIDLPESDGAFHGQVLGFYNRVPVYFHGQESDERTDFGQQFQCVELINRYYAVRLEFRNLQYTGHADSYFWQAKEKGLMALPNGGTNEPEVDDILVFDWSNRDGNPGHTALVYGVGPVEVCFVQQNIGDRWHDCLPIKRNGGKWFVDTIGTGYQFPVAGWSRIAHSKSDE